MKHQILIFLSSLMLSCMAFAQYEFSPAPVGDEISVSNGSQNIYISNTSGSSQTLNLSISQSGMSIASNRCTTVLANNRSCYIILSVNQTLLPVGTTIANLNTNSSLLVKLKFVKEAPLEFSEFSSSSVSLTGFSNQTISIKNKTLSSKSYSPFFSGADASKFEVILNRCSNIAPNVSCQITYRLKPQGAGSYSAQLSDSLISSPVSVSASIDSNAPGVIQPVVKSISISTSSLDFGTLSRYGMSNPINVLITNTGNATVSPILNFSSKMGLVLNRCSSILAGQSCSISLGINPDSSMSNGPILGQSIGIKAHSSDAEQTISVSAILSVINVSSCNSSQHLELGVCVSNTRSCSISNGTGTQSWSSNAWGSCSVSSCDSGYYDNFSLSCNLITYSPTYSSYSPNPSSIAACEGIINSTRSISSCFRDDNFTFVSTSNCSDSQPSIFTNSPAGTINVSISNGSESRSCNEGSTVQNLISRSCNGSYHDDGFACSADTYYSSVGPYTPEIPASLQPCDGTVVSNRSIIECRRQHDSLLVSNVFCSDPQASVSTLSPAGNINVSISHGSEIRSCSSGSTSQSFASRSCDTDYHDSGSSCVQNVYVPTYSSYSPPIPSSLQVCEGTVESTRTISECRQQHDNQLVSPSLCSDPSPSVSTLSPSGNINSSISNGSETYSCSMGSTSQSFVSRSCDSGFYDSGSSCSMISYVPSFSSYSPPIPSNLQACDGTVVSNRSISECRQQHDNAIVSNSNCSDPSPSVSTLSPSGNVNISITNGSETRSCSEGSTSQSFVSRSCNSNYIDNGSSCESQIISLSSGSSQYTFATLNSEGKMYGWGSNGWGNLGINNTSNQPTPLQPVNSGVLSGKTIKQMHIGLHNTCVIASDNLPYCWGSNLQGSLGNGNSTQSNVPVAVTTSGVLSGKTGIKILAVVQATCMLASDNQVYCWGRNAEGNLGNSSTTASNVPVAVTTSGALSGKTVVDIYMSGTGSTSSACAKTSDNRYYCWGDNTNGQLCRTGSTTSPAEINMSGGLSGKTITKMIMTSQKTYVIASDGTAYGCGANNLGQLGINSTSTATLPTQVSTINLGGRTIKDISPGSTYGCLITNDDLVYCWGANTSGQTGLGVSSGNTLAPTAVTSSGVLSGKTIKKLAVSSNGNTTVVIANDDKIYSWGNGFYGTLGDNSSTDSNVPVAIASANALNSLTSVNLAVGLSSVCALTSTNKVYCWGQGQYNGTSGGTIYSPALVSFP